jgi:hypothetical protein
MASVKTFTVLGASAEDVLHLKLLLDRASHQLIPPWRHVNVTDCDLAIIDVDSIYGHMDWLRAHAEGRRTAVMTAHAGFKESDLVLVKPVTMDQLIIVLRQAADHHPAHREPAVTHHEPVPVPHDDYALEYSPDAPSAPRSVVGKPTSPVRRAATPAEAPTTPIPKPIIKPIIKAPIAAPTPPARVVEPPAAPVAAVLAWHLTAGALSKPVRLRCDDAPALTIDIANQQFHASGNLRALSPYCTRQFLPQQFEVLGAAEFSKAQSEAPAHSVTRLIWLCHALGSPGRLNPALDPNGKYKLARWPQIEREFPKHFRIATVMLKQMATLADVAEQSGAVLADVIEFTNAYHAIGFIEVDAPATAAATSRDSGAGALLSRLRRPFGGG